MTKIAALTHVRKDDFFLQMWVDYYATVCGRSNLHVLLDGDDWEPDVDLRGVQVEVLTGREGLRVRDDARLAEAHTRLLPQLFNTYDFVIRGDCDEFVCIDPASNLSWGDALEETREHGYVYCNGVDIIHAPQSEQAFDPAGYVLQQRRYGVVQKNYFKPNVMSRPIATSAGGHRADGPVVVSNHFFMFHLANFDEDVMVDRLRMRQSDASGGSYDSHVVTRRRVSETLATCDAPLSLDDGVARGRYQLTTRGNKPVVYRPQKFRDGNVQIEGQNAYLVELDPRFDTIIAPAAMAAQHAERFALTA